MWQWNKSMSSNYEFRSITYIIASQPTEGSGGMKVKVHFW